MTTNRSRRLAEHPSIVAGFFVATVMVSCGSPSTKDTPATSALGGPCVESVGGTCGQAPIPTGARLWILNQGGDPLQPFFDCVLEHSQWNAFATKFPSARPMHLGAEIVVDDHYPCVAPDHPIGSQYFYQCAADQLFNQGHWIRPYDVLLVVVPDGSIGGADNDYSSNPTNILSTRTGSKNDSKMSILDPNHNSVPIVGAHVGNAQDYLFVYAGHEAYEAQTDGSSVDCCDGQTKGNLCNACAWACGDIGPSFTTIDCGGRTFEYERVSWPSHEFGGTADTCHDL
jgi:hypothetical protein